MIKPNASKCEFIISNLRKFINLRACIIFFNLLNEISSTHCHFGVHYYVYRDLSVELRENHLGLYMYSASIHSSELKNKTKHRPLDTKKNQRINLYISKS